METSEGTILPVESLVANPGEELMGREDEHVLDGTLPYAVTLNTVS